MTIALHSRDVYEDFDPKHEPLFFKLGAHGDISFHGSNYNIRKRLTAEQRKSLLTSSAFVRIDANCYVNVDKIRSIEHDCIRFASDDAGTSKHLPVSRRKQQLLRQRMAQMNV